MKVNFLWRNPIALILVTVIFSIISIVILLISFFSKSNLPFQMNIFIVFVILYSSAIATSFYWAYRSSKYAFMSPKKYRKAILINQKNLELKDVLVQVDRENANINPDKAIDKAIEILKTLK